MHLVRRSWFRTFTSVREAIPRLDSGTTTPAVTWEVVLSSIRELKVFVGEGKALPLLMNSIVDSRYVNPRNIVHLPPSLRECDSYLAEEGVLLEDICGLSDSELSVIKSVGELRQKLYGESCFPIPNRNLPKLFSHSTDGLHHSDVRRQLLVERLVNLRAIYDSRIYNESVSSLGMMGTIKNHSVKAMWASWINAVAHRIEVYFEHYHKGTLDKVENVGKKNSANAALAVKLLVGSKLSPKRISAILCVSATSDICSSKLNKFASSSSTGRSTKAVDDCVFESEMRYWTNDDLYNEFSGDSISGDNSGQYGKTSFVSLCETVGSAVMFESAIEQRGISSKSNSPSLWCKKDKYLVGSELVRILLSECYFEQRLDLVLQQIDKRKRPKKNSDGLFEIDPQVELFQWSREGLGDVTKTPQYNSEKASTYVHAFRHFVEGRGFKQTGYVAMDPQLARVMESIAPSSNFFRLLPMLIPPAGWNSYWQCGYLTRRVPLVRHAGSTESASDFANSSTFDKTIECMNYLGATKWVVNTVLLDYVEQAMKMTNEPEFSIPGIPARFEEHEGCSAPPGANRTIKRLSVMPKSHKRTELLSKLKNFQKLKNEYPIFVSKIKVARDFRNAKALYFPHSIDFRGRAYPVPAPFNHQGDDVVRALLIFGDAKPLGDRGWFWLKVHCANLLGMDKKTLEERVAWVDENMDRICKVGANPLMRENVEFVASKTDDFWQAVSTCIEISNAVKSGKPSMFLSQLPVHQDGSCNGLQHYAALGRDPLGALAVNVVPSSKVEDVYSVVLDIVKEKVKVDAKGLPGPKLVQGELFKNCPDSFQSLKGNGGAAKLARSTLAQIALSLDCVLQRKTVKQTVMTICYGVTQLGAGAQIKKQLEDMPQVKAVLNANQIAVLSHYLAKHTMQSIDTVFKQAMAIKDWFDQIAAIANKLKVPINWVSPAGVPCRQPYRKLSLMEVRTPLQKISIMDDEKNAIAPIHPQKQRMGFPPNFVHSLDSSHMILTAIKCKKLGVASFASVHDSFWTHAADVDTMNVAIREEFLNMHSMPILENLREAFVMGFGEEGVNVPPLPKQGNLDLSQVVNSVYFFD